jgi:hypothetical protein
VILFREQIDILSFIGFSGLLINIILYLLFYVSTKYRQRENNTYYRSTQKHNNLSLLKRFRRFFINDLFGLPLETEHLGCICFPESGFREITFQTFLYLFIIRKIGQQKTLSGQRKIWLGFQKSVFLLFWVKNTFLKL